MRKIRVVEYTDCLGFGGTEKVLGVFCKYLDREKYDIFVCAMKRDERSGREQAIRDSGVDIHFADGTRSGLRSYFKEVKPDILHIHRMGSTQEGVISVAKEAGVPIVIEHNIFGFLDKSGENELIDCHIFISYSCAWRYQMMVKQPLVLKKYEVLYYPIEIESFDRFGFDDRDYSRKIIGRIGRDDNTKWDMGFIEALPLIVKAIPELEFHVIGITPEIYKKVQSMGCEKNLVICPMTTNESEIMEFYSKISVLAHFAEIGETFGLVLAEANAAKLPVVTHYTFGKVLFRDTAQSEVINHGYNGFVAINALMYANGVIMLLQNPELAKQFGLQGYLKAKMCYDAQVITGGLEKIFMNHLKAKGLC